jgi:hypothetical protein
VPYVAYFSAIRRLRVTLTAHLVGQRRAAFFLRLGVDYEAPNDHQIHTPSALGSPRRHHHFIHMSIAIDTLRTLTISNVSEK